MGHLGKLRKVWIDIQYYQLANQRRMSLVRRHIAIETSLICKCSVAGCIRVSVTQSRFICARKQFFRILFTSPMRDVKKSETFPLQTLKKRKCPYIEKKKPFHWLHTHKYTHRFQNLAINIQGLFVSAVRTVFYRPEKVTLFVSVISDGWTAVQAIN